ncbi:MAG: UDP-N-acetylmuramate--L-alanine ligase [Candidatus Alectryocaccobium sp.]|jgi:UDP-N-acetylmuramate--alanine ligase|nr:UDP-N-acetylmuramate--L-alanine ligase [Candidatus Alectryocaccobium sp.]
MYKLDFNKPINIHFIGIGGISMSGLAEILLDRGFMISGSDRQESALTKKLESNGALIFYGQKAENISDKCDLVVYTAAIHPDNPEYARAKELGIPLITRADLLGQMMMNYRSSIAVSGTHGKTTTTSMLAHILLAADTDPTVSVGGILHAIDGNIRIGASDYFLTEACEYTNSFLHFNPTLGVILNVEEDHLDFFKDIDDIRHSFQKFTGLLPKDGALVINADINDYSYFTKDLSCRVITYSVDSPADLTACDISFNEFAIPSFTAVYKGKKLGRFELKVPGRHNISNALAAIGASLVLGIDTAMMAKGLSSFTGTDRRFQFKGKVNGASVVDDYAHHPTEIRATLSTALKCPHKKLWVIFQPHTYSRTKAFFNDFIDALSAADEVILAEIYAARETNTFGVTSADIAKEISQNGTKASYFPTFKEIEDYIKPQLKAGDLVLTMGAGNVTAIGDELLKEND